MNLIEVGIRMKFYEATVDSNSKIYVDKSLKRVLKVDVGDTVEFFIENGRVEVRKKQ